MQDEHQPMEAFGADRDSEDSCTTFHTNVTAELEARVRLPESFMSEHLEARMEGVAATYRQTSMTRSRKQFETRAERWKRYLAT